MSETVEMPFELECQGIQIFNKSGIISAKVGGELKKLAGLYSRLETALEKRGFEKETRKFRPHITLARKFHASSGFDIESIPYSYCGFKVDKIILFESRRDVGKLVYVPLFVHKLEERLES